MIKYFPLLLFAIYLSSCAAKHDNIPDDYKNFVGVWELIRYDNIRKIDTPPAGITNTTYFFYEDGRYRFFRPGQESTFVYGRGNTPFKKYIPVYLKNNYIKTWFGLTNDLNGVKKFAFFNSEELQIQFRDGSIATLHKTLAHPSEYIDKNPICVPHTIRGKSYFPDYISSITKDMRVAEENSQFKETIIGTWKHQDLKKPGKSFSMIFFDNGKYQAVSTRKSTFSSEVKEYKVAGTYELYGDILKINTQGCFGPNRIKIADNILTLIGYKDEMSLQKIE